MINFCPLCYSENTHPFHEDTKRIYLKCRHCDLVFVPKDYHLTPDQEKLIYDQHQNNPEDIGYRQFLNRLAQPLLSLLNEYKFPKDAQGLDFGAGPGPTLSLMLQENGYKMTVFDVFYAKNQEALKQKYDFITATEVWEHLSQPGKVIDSLFSMGKEKFLMGIMTKRVPNSHFGAWHYIKDPTHITFYDEKTLAYIADKYACRLELPSNDTAIFIRDKINRI